MWPLSAPVTCSSVFSFVSSHFRTTDSSSLDISIFILAPQTAPTFDVAWVQRHRQLRVTRGYGVLIWVHPCRCTYLSTGDSSDLAHIFTARVGSLFVTTSFSGPEKHFDYICETVFIDVATAPPFGKMMQQSETGRGFFFILDWP